MVYDLENSLTFLKVADTIQFMNTDSQAREKAAQNVISWFLKPADQDLLKYLQKIYSLQKLPICIQQDKGRRESNIQKIIILL